MDDKLAKIYYSPAGYFKGIADIKKLAAAAKPRNSGCSNKRCGRFTCLGQRMFRGRNSMFLFPTGSTRRIFFFYRMTNYREAARFSNMLWLLLMRLAGTKRQNRWLPKTQVKLQKASQIFINARRWCGQKCCKLILARNSWAKCRKRWINRIHSSDVGVLKFTVTRQSLKDSTELLPKGCLVTSTLLKCWTLNRGQLLGVRGFQRLLLPSTMRRQVWQVRSPQMQSKKRLFMPNLRHLTSGLLERMKKSSPLLSALGICTNLVSWKVVEKEPQTQFGLWKFSTLKG